MVTDAAVLSKVVDGVVFVVSYHYQATRRRFVQHAMEELRTVLANIAGVVLNRYPTDGDSYSYGGYYGRGGYYDGGESTN